MNCIQLLRGFFILLTALNLIKKLEVLFTILFCSSSGVMKLLIQLLEDIEDILHLITK